MIKVRHLDSINCEFSREPVECACEPDAFGQAEGVSGRPEDDRMEFGDAGVPSMNRTGSITRYDSIDDDGAIFRARVRGQWRAGPE